MNKLPTYRITIDPEYSNGEDLGISAIAFTANPAIKVKGLAFSASKTPVKQSFKDEIKMRICAPVLIPMEIYRNDEDGEYFVKFTEQEIENIHQKMMANLNNSSMFNLEHDEKKTVPAYILETWLVSNNPKEDKAFSTFGIDVPPGTLMIVAQITDKEYYTKLVDNDQIGLSIEGFLGLKLSDIKIAEELITLDNIKNKNKKQNNTMILKDGTKFSVDGKQYVVLAGVVTEDVTEETVEEKEELAEDAVIEETPVEEIPVKEDTTKIDEEFILSVIQPKLDEIYKLIAELKAEEIDDDEEITPVDTKMSIHDKFAAVMKLVKE